MNDVFVYGLVPSCMFIFLQVFGSKADFSTIKDEHNTLVTMGTAGYFRFDNIRHACQPHFRPMLVTLFVD